MTSRQQQRYATRVQGKHQHVAEAGSMIAAAGSLHDSLMASLQRFRVLTGRVERAESGRLAAEWSAAALTELATWRSLATALQDLAPNAITKGLHVRLQRYTGELLGAAVAFETAITREDGASIDVAAARLSVASGLLDEVNRSTAWLARRYGITSG